MKVLVIGGTGAFGARLCDLLARDGVDVTVAGRGPARRVVRHVGAQNSDGPVDFPYVTLDRDGPLSALDAYDVIVDAAGPFHAYGDDPYRVARAAIAAGAHYFDLSDNADFCQGISVLNADAKAAGVCVLSGMSSVPAISSAAVDALRAGQTPVMIESAILPGNKAPRGRAVVESILNQTGKFYPVKQGGQDVQMRSWSDPRTYNLGPYTRQGWRIEVPDQRLFPDHFNCPTVAFRASLELGVMRYGLGVLSFVRGKLGFGMPGWFVSLVMMGAKMLAPFGTDRGGMVVEVTLPNGAGFLRKTWVLRAKNGDGPYVPGIAVRAACRMLDALPRGAAPALSVIPLAEIEACLTDLAIETEVSETAQIPIFTQVLGSDLDMLPDAVRATHDGAGVRHFKGRASVMRGAGVQARIAALLFGFPPTTDDTSIEVTKSPSQDGETWVRCFGTQTFGSHLLPTPRGMSERFGALTFQLALHVQDDKLYFPVSSGCIWGIPIPRFLLPRSEASEAEVDGVFHFDVHLKAPTGATMVHYKGWLKRA